ncbi:hypothetical protein B0T22DRAFT_450441 [Podospora appendiculata]|uniref:gamma-glutamylcyclotransferase n=1 Tax=Podospora appendiculata TaxID=314037 RepID=A0AAE0XHP3_9PEZI|nr:hypothetical protein B0T22DRAFT_450441 [Podospora appendiculata]
MASATATDAVVPTKLYFGYGSNLWKAQMTLRCPTSQFEGIGRLRRYEWVINSRGYANIAATGSDTDEVWGLVYSLSASDESRLDVNEGVPHAYEKRMQAVEFWDGGNGGGGAAAAAAAAAAAGKEIQMLVYIDFLRTSGEGNKPKPEYVHRMNMGISDALGEGMPKSYVDAVLRRWIPEEEGTDAVRELALKQAVRFEEETAGVGTRPGSGFG